MKKKAVILACMLVYSGLFSGCANDKDSSSLNKDSGNAVEIIDTDIEEEGDIDQSSDDGDIEYEFKDPENADSIEVIPKE